MKLGAIIKISFAAILTNKVRSVLTTLGIIIGIGAVIALLSLGQGAQSSIVNQVQSLGSNTITIIPIGNLSGKISPFGGASNLALLRNSKLDYKILNLFENKVKYKEVTGISPENNTSQEVSYRAVTINPAVSGVQEIYFSVRDLKIAKGRKIMEDDNKSQAKVAVLGASAVTKLFGESDAVGKTIKIKDTGYRVIGIATAKSSSYDDKVFIPLNTASNLLIGNKDLSQIILQVENENQVDNTASKIEEDLMRYFRIQDKENAKFSVFTSKDTLALTESITGIFTTLLASIAGISLLVGGIGIMNIMLVSVTERTKEIGLRKAVGAKKRDVLAQFLVESVLLTLTGGIIGIILGISLAYLVGSIGNIPVILSPQAILLATSVSITIGVIFGFYPAYRAASLNPIDALRYE